MADKGLELGFLAPLREVLAEVQRREKDDRDRRPADDPGLLALTDIRKLLETAIADAQNPPREPTVAELAELEGVSIWTIYKRRQRAQNNRAA